MDGLNLCLSYLTLLINNGMFHVRDAIFFMCSTHLDIYPPWWGPGLSRQKWLCWNIVNCAFRNKLQWNFNQNLNIFIQENALKMSSAKWRPFCLGLNVLMCYVVLVGFRVILLLTYLMLVSVPAVYLVKCDWTMPNSTPWSMSQAREHWTPPGQD